MLATHRRSRWRRCAPHAYAVAAYAVLAMALAWPLPLHIATSLTGPPDGDTGVYVWNLWVFQHQILVHHASPYFSDAIFALTDRANLSLHNYTTLANLLALPLIGLADLGVVATFNTIYLFMTVLSAYAMFLLARAINAGADGEAWLAGVLFAWSPMLVTRGAGHFSLVAAAPLPLFVLLLMRAHRHRRVGDGARLGLIVAVAFWADVYYAVYCLMLGTAYIMWHVVQVERLPETVRDRQARRWRSVDMMILLVGCVILAVLLTGGWSFTAFGQPVSIRELYTPVLILSSLITFRVLRGYRVRLVSLGRADVVTTARLVCCTGLVAAVALSPVLYAMSIRIAQGRFVSPAIHWRSSPAGVGLLSMLLPNPNHPLAPAAWRAWLSARYDGYLESVASIPVIAVLVLFFAWRHGWRAPRLWVALGVAFTLLAFGPFIHIAGLNTYVPGPWALVRYVPVFNLARNPARFAVLIMLALAVLFALALSHLRDTRLAGRPWVRWGIGALMILELLPIPRTLHSARIPAIYDRVAADPRNIRVLELPFGVRDGTFSVGNYTARTQFFQTAHGKSLFGGVLSRVSDHRVRAVRGYPMLDAFIQLSEGRSLPPTAEERLIALAPGFLARANIGYVVIDHARASAALVHFARRTLRLEALELDGSFVLYRPAPISLEHTQSSIY